MSLQAPPRPTQMSLQVPPRLENGRPAIIIGEKSKTENLLKPESDNPDKFCDEKHEKQWELKEHKKKMIMKIEREEIVKHIKDYDPRISDEHVFKNPINYEAREAAVREKIFHATGILPHNLDILRVSVSTKRAELAWILFNSARTGSEIFRLAMQNGGYRSFNAFPHI